MNETAYIINANESLPYHIGLVVIAVETIRAKEDKRMTDWLAIVDADGTEGIIELANELLNFDIHDQESATEFLFDGAYEAWAAAQGE